MVNQPQTSPEEQRLNPDAPDTTRLACQIAALAGQTSTTAQLYHCFLTFCVGFVNAAGGIISEAQGKEVRVAEEMLSLQAMSWSATLRQELLTVAEKAHSSGHIAYQPLKALPSVWIISSPYIASNGQSGCLTLLILLGQTAPDPFVITIQLLASVLSSSILRQDTASSSLQTIGELSTVLADAFSVQDQEQRLLQLNAQLRHWCQCAQVAIGTAAPNRKLRLHSLSDATTIDHRTTHVKTIEQALSACLNHQAPCCWPRKFAGFALDDQPIFNDLLKETGTCLGVGMRLDDPDAKLGGALVLLWDHSPPEEITEKLRHLVHFTPLISRAVLAATSRQANVITEKQKATASRLPFLRRGMVAILLVLCMIGALCIPVPHTLNAESVVKPVTVRYVISRYDGILETVQVKPGDPVSTGDILANLDGKEVEIQQANLIADKHRARKLRDQYMASGNTAAVQIARLDEKRIEEELNLLAEKQRYLILRSPINGIVLTGDLERRQGSPVTKGQNLFAVAPLARMTIELAVRDTDISYLQRDMPVAVRFSSFPDKKWTGTIEHIVPQSIVRDNRNVFLAQCTVNNEREMLRPGMQGKGRIGAGLKPIGWQLFRRPWYTFRSFLDRFFLT